MGATDCREDREALRPSRPWNVTVAESVYAAAADTFRDTVLRSWISRGGSRLNLHPRYELERLNGD